MSVLIAGEINPDLILSNYSSFPHLGQEILVEDSKLALGSASAICAAGLARLGTAVRFLGYVGADTWGDFCLGELNRLGVDTSWVRQSTKLGTGLTVSVSSAKDRALITYLGAIAELSANDVPWESLEGIRHLHVSSFFLQTGLRPGLRGLFAEAHARGLTTSLDPGFDPNDSALDDLLDLLPFTDIFFPNEVELEKITGIANPADALAKLENGHTRVVAKLGARGAMTMVNGELLAVPPFAVTPVDTTGAGDSFNAGFLHAWLRGEPLLDALRFACACGALSTQGLGGAGAQPTADEANALIHGRTAASAASANSGAPGRKETVS